MRIHKMQHCSLVLLLLAICGNVNAGGLFGDGGVIRGDIGDFFDKTVDKPISGASKEVGRATKRIARETGKVTNRVVNELNRGSHRLLGRVGGEAFSGIVNDLIRRPLNWATSAAQSGGEVLNGGSVRNLPFAPVAAEMRHSRDSLYRYAKRIPSKIYQQLLQGGFPRSTLNRARYIVLDADFQSHNVHTYATGVANQAAIVFDDVIAFGAYGSRRNVRDIWLWAHEMQHVRQYEVWGVDKFARKYSTDHSAIESEADAVANGVTKILGVRSRSSFASKSRSNRRQRGSNNATESRGSRVTTNTRTNSHNIEFARQCRTNYGNCFLNVRMPKFQHCYCVNQYGQAAWGQSW